LRGGAMQPPPGGVSNRRLQQTVNVYDVSIWIPGAIPPPFFLGTVAVAESQLLQSQGFHILLGRDILAYCMVHYSGPLNLVTVSY
jgi:hypothetical protein